MIASANALVPAVPPRSYVDGLACRDHVAEGALDPSATSGWPRWRSISAPDRMRAVGFALFMAGVLRRRAMDGLEDGCLRSDVRTRRDTQPADKAGREVADDVAIQVRQHEDVVEVRLLDELHAHVVDDPVLERDPAVVLGGDRPTALEEEAVGQLHDVRLVDRRDLAAPVRHGIVEGEPGDPLGGGPGDDLDALSRVRADHVLDAGVEVLGVLADDDEIDVLVAGLETLDRASRSEVGVQPERLAERDVDAPEALADRGRDRALEGDLVSADRFQDVLGERRAVLRDDGLACVDRLPFELDPGRVEDPPSGFRQLRTDAVAGDQGHTVGHGPIVAALGRSSRQGPHDRRRFPA